MRIKQAAGWNQTENDWRTLLQLAPETCFGLECEGVLAATTTAVCYGTRLAWIGMVLTDPAYRRRGFARQLFAHTLAALAARRIAWIKLDATASGAPLYRQFGFVEESPVERWHAAGLTVAPPRVAPWSPECAALDREAFGADRSELLSQLALQGAAAIPNRGYAMARPGSEAAYFGPCVSRDAEAARALLAWFRARHSGENAYWDILPHNTAAVRLARASGFTPLRRLVRMLRPGVPAAPPLAPRDDYTFALAGFEYG